MTHSVLQQDMIGRDDGRVIWDGSGARRLAALPARAVCSGHVHAVQQGAEPRDCVVMHLTFVEAGLAAKKWRLREAESSPLETSWLGMLSVVRRYGASPRMPRALSKAASSSSRSLALTDAMRQHLRTTQRRMLRWMMPTAKHAGETWPDYIQQATHKAEAMARNHGVTDWVELQERRKWELAGKAARHSDNRWTTRLLGWKPWFRCTPYRNVGRPVTRWEDSIVNIAGGNWQISAQDSCIWSVAAH